MPAMQKLENSKQAQLLNMKSCLHAQELVLEREAYDLEQERASLMDEELPALIEAVANANDTYILTVSCDSLF